MSNMVSKIMKIGLLLFAAISILTACDKKFELDLPLAVDSHEYNLTSKAGETRIFFYTTKSWKISLEPADCSWATVNRTSGKGKEDVEEIIFTYTENLDPDRQVTIVINAGDLQEKITMFQRGTAREWWDGSTSIDDLIVKPL